MTEFEIIVTAILGANLLMAPFILLLEWINLRRQARLRREINAMLDRHRRWLRSMDLRGVHERLIDRNPENP